MFFIAAVITITMVSAFIGFRWFTEWQFLITTDDAYVQGDITAIAPKVTGYIEQMAVDANQTVKKGDVLFRLDDGDYRIALHEAEAHLLTQKQTLLRITAQIEAAKTSLDESQAAKTAAVAIATNAQLTFKRATQL